MIGTCFLYLYWPSFNAALGEFGSAQHRAVINTLLANSTSVISACLFSRITKKYLDMIIIVNATLAGGAALGASADLINYPFCSMIIGFICGAIAALGFAYVAPFLQRTIKLHDTQGVQYIHGWAGIIGGFVSTISCAFAETNFGDRYPDYFYSKASGALRTHREQAGYQLASLGVSLGLALFGGLVAGFIASRSFFQAPHELFDDTEHWHEVEPPTDDDLHFANKHLHHSQSLNDSKKIHNHSGHKEAEAEEKE